MVGTWYAIELYSGLTVDAKPLISKCIVDTMTRAGPNEITDVERYEFLFHEINKNENLMNF
jgi:hypothetical protein